MIWALEMPVYCSAEKGPTTRRNGLDDEVFKGHEERAPFFNVFPEGNKNMVHPESPLLCIPLTEYTYRFPCDAETIEKALFYDCAISHLAILA